MRKHWSTQWTTKYSINLRRPRPLSRPTKALQGPRVTLSLTTEMDSLMEGVTGTAPGDTSSHSSLAVKGGIKRPRSRHPSRLTVIYCQINKELLRGVEGKPVGQSLTQNSSICNDLKQFSKVGFEEAKSMDRKKISRNEEQGPSSGCSGTVPRVDFISGLKRTPGAGSRYCSNRSR
jgi:hypothetical protein